MDPFLLLFLLFLQNLIMGFGAAFIAETKQRDRTLALVLTFLTGIVGFVVVLLLTDRRPGRSESVDLGEVFEDHDVEAFYLSHPEIPRPSADEEAESPGA